MGEPGSGGTVAGSASQPVPPPDWKCDAALYADDTCHCGCGSHDPDCGSTAADACEVCDAEGSCSPGDCPGRIDSASNALCAPLPAAWRCDDARYLDGESCDCGCGAPDPDCEDEEPGSCDACDDPASCSAGDCSSLDPENNAVCPVPPNWACAPPLYSDGVCHCGCGVVDIDCADTTAAACENCPNSSCSPFTCDVREDNNAICRVAPALWRCSPAVYATGEQCDCGCGFPDPDCAGNDRQACDSCNSEGSCSIQPCPGTIDPDQAAYCLRPEPPPEWTCDADDYADSLSCDCACGAPDLDCPTVDIEHCERCPTCTNRGCERADPVDTTLCVAPPAGWMCDAMLYADTSCQCGCGIRDPDCTITVPGYCNDCPEEGCTGGDCSLLDPSNEARCLSPG
jgi:hypothetical protein